MRIIHAFEILGEAVCGVPASTLRLWRAARGGDDRAAYQLRLRKSLLFFILAIPLLTHRALGLLPLGSDPTSAVRIIAAVVALIGFSVCWFGLLALMVGRGEEQDISDAFGLSVVTAVMVLAAVALA